MSSEKTKIEKIIELISECKAKELMELTKKMEEEFGISTAAPVAMVASAATGEAAPADEDQNFDVILQSFGEKKIDIIKIVRGSTGLGLKEAKDLVEKGGQSVKKNLEKAPAEELKKQLEDAGATVELKAS